MESVFLLDVFPHSLFYRATSLSVGGGAGDERKKGDFGYVGDVARYTIVSVSSVSPLVFCAKRVV